MAGVTDDNVIHNFNPEQLTSAGQFAGDPDIRVTRHRIPGGMVVQEDHGMRRGHNCGPEHLAAVRKGLVEKTDGHQVMPSNPLPGVEQEDGEAFAVGVELWGGRNVQAPVVSGTLRRVAKDEL